MGKTKGEHFVPQCYLKMFASDGKLNVYDKKKGEIRPNQSVDKVAKQNAFYDFSPEELQGAKQLHPDIDDIQHIEEFFKVHVETDLKQLLDLLQPSAIPQDPDLIVQLDDELKINLSIQMAYQFLRTKEFRNELPELPSVDSAFLQKIILIDDNIIARWAKFFYDFKWLVGINQTDIPLYTSDNPVCIYDSTTDKTGLGALKSDRNMMIYYPLSPLAGITLFGIKSDFIPSSLVMPIDNDYQINFQNTLQYKNAEAYVFSGTIFQKMDQLICFSSSFKNMNVSSQDAAIVERCSEELAEMLKSGNIDPARLQKNSRMLSSLAEQFNFSD